MFIAQTALPHIKILNAMIVDNSSSMLIVAVGI